MAAAALLAAALSGDRTLAAQERAEPVATVRGVVRDSSGGEAITANVALVLAGGTTHGTRTDAAGGFVVRASAAGPATLRVRALGYRGASIALELRAGQDTTIALRLAPVAITLAPVRTVATAPERQRFEETADVGTFTVAGRSLMRVPGVGEGDVLRAVATMPGATARNDFMAGLNVRGGEADQNLVLLDGIPVYNPFHLGGLFGTFIDETVERIDFATGAFAAPNGGRLSSVLDVQTVQEARTGVHGAAEVSLLASTLTLGGATNDARRSWNVAVRRTYADVVAAALTPEQFPYHFQDAQLRGSTLLPGGGTLSLTAYAGVDVLYDPESSVGCGDCGDEPFHFDWGNRLVGLTLTQPLGERTSLAQRAWFSSFRTHLDDEGGAIVLDDALDDFGLGGTLTRRHGDATLSAGYELSRYFTRYREFIAAEYADDFDDEGESDVTLRQAATAGALFAEGQWRRGRVLLRPGVRVEAATGAGWMGASPRLSAKLFVTPDLAITAGASRHTQLLHAVRNEDLPIKLFDLWITSTDRVPPSRSTHLVGGVERWWGERHLVRIEAWRKSFRDLPEPPTTIDPRIRIDDLRLFDGRSYGVDVFLRRFEHGRVGGWLSYGYAVNARTRDGSTYAPAHDRRHNANLVMSWVPSRRWSVGGRMAVASGTPFTGVAGTYAPLVYDPATRTWRPSPDTNIEDADSRGDRNALRYPTYVRADLSIERSWYPGRAVVRPYLQVVNATNHRNVMFYDFDLDAAPPTAKTIGQFPLLPSIGVKVEW